MNNHRRIVITMAIVFLLCGCSVKKKQPVFTADFSLGKMKVIKKEKELAEGVELTLMTRYALKKELGSAGLSTYFQYELGNKIKLVINNDTIKPSLTYYVPLISETEKEIDCKYMLKKEDADRVKRIIVNDSILDFNKINISFK